MLVLAEVRDVLYSLLLRRHCDDILPKSAKSTSIYLAGVLSTWHKIGFVPKTQICGRGTDLGNRGHGKAAHPHRRQEKLVENGFLGFAKQHRVRVHREDFLPAKGKVIVALDYPDSWLPQKLAPNPSPDMSRLFRRYHKSTWFEARNLSSTPSQHPDIGSSANLLGKSGVLSFQQKKYYRHVPIRLWDL